MSRISTIVSQPQKISDDKSFMFKISFLLAAIMGLSAYIILQNFTLVSSPVMLSSSNSNLVTLESIEREINGNIVSLDIVEDDFSELALIDLSDISFEKQMQEPLVSEKNVQSKPTVALDQKVATPKVKEKKVFISSQDGNSLSFIKKKFYATNNSVFSIKLSQRFFEAKKYNQALKWALISNEVNSKSDKSWIMFAKIKDKMGKKQDAINALTQYLKNNSSKEITKLLKNLKVSV
jgi:hypothetical protein